MLRIDLGPMPEGPERRDATVVVRVEGYSATRQIMETSVRTQLWTLDGRSWWVEPGQERGIAP